MFVQMQIVNYSVLSLSWNVSVLLPIVSVKLPTILDINKS